MQAHTYVHPFNTTKPIEYRCNTKLSSTAYYLLLLVYKQTGEWCPLFILSFLSLLVGATYFSTYVRKHYCLSRVWLQFPHIAPAGTRLWVRILLPPLSIKNQGSLEKRHDAVGGLLKILIPRGRGATWHQALKHSSVQSHSTHFRVWLCQLPRYIITTTTNNNYTTTTARTWCAATHYVA